MDLQQQRIQASLLHGELVKIHPFIDGNGRTSRLIMNLDLMNNGYNPVIIKKKIDYNITMLWTKHILQ